MTIDEWFASVDGKSVGPNDTNGQCVGLYYDYMSNCLGIEPVSTQFGKHAGYAIGTWDSGTPPGGLTAISGSDDIRKGDIVFWNWGGPFTPLSHVAVAMGTNTVLGSGNFASQNSPLPFAVKQQLPLAGVAGVWRPANSPGMGPLWIGPIPLDPNQVAKGAAAAANPLAQFGKVLGTVSNPEFWKRAGLMVLGVILLLIAFWSLIGESVMGSGVVKQFTKVAKQ